MKPPLNIVLIGFMGCGKTSTGKELAKRLKLEFFDLDQWIEEKIGKKVARIFEEDGEAYFRKQERQAVQWMAGQERSVIATGGGAWLDPPNRERLLKTGWCVWLQVSPECAWQRVGNHLFQRPLLAGAENPLEEIRKKMEERNPVYSLAHAGIDTDGKTPRHVALEIIEALQGEKPLDGSRNGQ